MNNISRGIIAISLLLSSSTFSQGLYGNFEKLIKGQKKKYHLLINSLLNQDFSLKDITDINQIRLDPSFLNLVIQNSPTRYILLATNDRCSLYDLMQTNLLKSPKGDLKHIVITYPDKNNVDQKRVLEKSKFLKLIAYKQCPKIQKFKGHFSTSSARKTLQQIKLIPPTSKDECHQLFENFTKDLKTPYLCHIIEELRYSKAHQKKSTLISKADYRVKEKLQKRLSRAASYNKVLSQKARKLLTGLCLNLHHPENFCSQYFSKSFWSHHFLKNSRSPILKSFCKGMNKKKCINTLSSSPQFCHYAGKKYPALFPKASCPNISRALLKSHTNKLHNDCPGKVGNETVTTFARLLNLQKNDTKEDQTCETNSTLPMAKFAGSFTDYNTWNINLCFLNKLNGNKKVCYPTIYGDAGAEDISLNRNVKKILERTKGFREGVCQIVFKKDYKAALLKFRSGCHIIVDDKLCTGIDCPIKVILDQREQKQIFQENKAKFNLFPYDFINEKKSLIKVLSKEYKLTLKSVKNMTTFLFIKKNHPKANFIGVGCREDLLPTFFAKKSLNQCHPLPFHIDGYFEQDGTYALITRTSLDQVHAPRIIPWTYIFNSLKNYQQIHPIKAWGFYALY